MKRSPSFPCRDSTAGRATPTRDARITRRIRPRPEDGSFHRLAQALLGPAPRMRSLTALTLAAALPLSTGCSGAIDAIPVGCDAGSCSDGGSSPSDGGAIDCSLPLSCDDGTAVLCENRIDYGLGWPTIRATFQYGAGGQLFRYVERTPEGAPIFALRRWFDPAGRRVRQEVETTLFSPSKRAMTWEYDDAGRVTRTTYEGWGTAGGVHESRFIHDAMGRRERVETLDDGVLTSVDRYQYIEGEPLIIEVGHDDGDDGTEEYAQRYHFTGGRWLSRYESLTSGVVVMTEDYTYVDGAEGRVSLRHRDGDGDGVIDGVTTFTWEPLGLAHYTETSTLGGSSTTSSYEFVYHGDGRLGQRTWTAVGGTWIHATIFTWSSALDRVARLDLVTGQPIDSWTFTRGCAGEPQSEVRLAPVSGWSDELRTFPFEVDRQKMWGFPEAL